MTTLLAEGQAQNADLVELELALVMKLNELFGK
jgi:hypothetical protein